MDDYLSWSDYSYKTREETCKQLLARLREARGKLTPIVDEIIMSTVELIRRGDERIINECFLTSDQYQDIIWASQILRDIEFDFKAKDNDYIIPNTNLIVNNVSVGSKSRMMSVRDKSIIIDEANIVELLEIYEHMGVVIQRILTQAVTVNDEPIHESIARITSGIGHPSEKSILKSPSSSGKHISEAPSSREELHEDKSKHSNTSWRESENDLSPPHIRSTLSALVNNSSANLNKISTQKVYSSERFPEEDMPKQNETKNHFDDAPTIYIKIQCFSDEPSHDYDTKFNNEMGMECAKSCPSHLHVQLDGEPVTLKMNQDNIANGTVYCINAGGNDDDNNDLKIIIRQCPDCMSTIIGSTSKIDNIFAESHESITLHGKGGDESNMAYSSSDDNSVNEPDLCDCLRKGRICIDISPEKCDHSTSPCRCEEYLSQIISDQKVVSQPKMDVVIDTDSVDRSTVKVHGSSEEDMIPERDISQASFGSKSKSSSGHLHGHASRSKSSLITEEPEYEEFPDHETSKKSKLTIHEPSELFHGSGKSKQSSMTIQEQQENARSKSKQSNMTFHEVEPQSSHHLHEKSKSRQSGLGARESETTSLDQRNKDRSRMSRLTEEESSGSLHPDSSGKSKQSSMTIHEQQENARSKSKQSNMTFHEIEPQSSHHLHEKSKSRQSGFEAETASIDQKSKDRSRMSRLTEQASSESLHPEEREKSMKSSLTIKESPTESLDEHAKNKSTTSRLTKQISESKSLASSHGPDRSRKSNLIIKEEDIGIPLTRRKICSSMEFDVATVKTRLRDHEIEHPNAHIVVELQKLGVDQILRACRPARCCRKAILNERQRTALPYCVSLKSLPLMGNDAEVIKQSIDMSVKKIKNSIDLNQAYKDKLAYYVDLGRDDFKPDIHYPWVIPVYDLKVGQCQPKDDDKFFLLKKTVTIPKQLGSVARLMTIIDREKENNQIEDQYKNLNNVANKKYFILKKPTAVRSDSSQINERRKMKQVRFEPHIKISDHKNQRYTKTVQCNKIKRVYKRKSIKNTNVDRKDWRLLLSQEHKELDLNRVNYRFDQTKIKSTTPTSSMSLFYQEVSSQVTSFKPSDKEVNKKRDMATETTSLRQPLASGDHSTSTLNVLEPIPNKEVKNVSTRDVPTEINSLTRVKSVPALYRPILEKSNALMLRAKLIRILERNQNIFQIPKVKPEEKLGTGKTPLKLQPPDEEPAKSVQKNLEYYVDLVDGNLVWGNTLPLKPQKYNAYYNYTNRSRENSSSANNVPVEDQMFVTRITPQESRRGQPTPAFSPSNSIGEFEESDPLTDVLNKSPSTISILSEMNEPFNRAQNVENLNTPKVPKPPPLPASFSSFSMGPESLYEPWAPHLISDISLPHLHEEIVTKKDVEVVEAVPVEQEIIEEEIIEEEENVCMKKTKCIENKCTDCRVKKCTSKKCAAKSCPSKECGKHHTGDVTIAIKKARTKGMCSEARQGKPCNKEICELYKNKNLMPGTSKAVSCDKKCTLKGRDTFEIYINNQKVCLTKCKVKKGTKESKNEKEPRS